MNSSSRIFLILAGLLCATLGALYYRSAQQGAQLERQLAQSREENNHHLSELSAAEAKHDKLAQQLVALDTDLGATKTKLTAAEAEKVQLTRDLKGARTDLAQLETEKSRLSAEAAQLRQALVTAKANVGDSAKLAQYEDRIASLEQQLAAARTAAPSVPAGPVLSTNRARSSVVVSIGPSDAFVVVNYGAAHGALPAQKLLIQRGTETIATALISDVREQHSIAQIDPESLRGALHKGDSAVLAN